MPGNRYFLCQVCDKVLRFDKHLSWGKTHCGLQIKRITDVEARQRVEGRRFKGRRTKVTGKVDSRADGEKHRIGSWHYAPLLGRSYEG